MHSAAGIITPEQAYVEMAMVLDKRLSLTQAESLFRWASRIEAVLEDDFGARGRNLREKIESSRKKLPADLLNQLCVVASSHGATDSAQPASCCVEILRQLLRRRPRRRMSLWPRLVETRGIVREICSYRLGPEGEYAALMDIDGRIVTLVSDSPASIEVGDTVIVAGFEKNRPFAYEKGASGIRMMKRPYSRLLVIGCLEAAVGLGTIGLAATFCMRAIQGGQAAIGLWKYLLIALAGAVSLLVGWYTLLVGGLAAFLSSVLTIRGDND